MKKNLLATTALVVVSFSMPAMAEQGASGLLKNNDVLSGTYTDQNNADKTQAGVATVSYNVKGVSVADGTKFNKNSTIASAGGALKLLNGITIGNDVEFVENKAENPAWGGGALYIKLADKDIPSENQEVKTGKVKFEKNEANLGGAIALEQGKLSIGSGSEFAENNATQGGAIMAWVDDEHKELPSELTINDTKFTKNTAVYGGAIFNEATVNIKGATTFEGNIAEKSGGAVQNWNAGELNIADGAKFINNISETASGGAIYNASKATLGNNIVFDGNKAAWGGAAISSGTNAETEGYELTIGDNAKFVNNTLTSEKSYGGAIFLDNDGNKDGATFTLGENASFESNQAQNGGAVYVKENINAEIGAGAIFTSNTAKATGGAIYLEGENAKLTLNSATFSENKAGDDYNDIHNEGTISVAEGSTLTLDGGVSGEGTMDFAKDTTLKINTITKMENTVTSAGTTLKVNIDEDVENIDLSKFLVEKVTLAENGLYNLVEGENKIYTVSEKSSSEIAASLGLTGTSTSALMAVLGNEAEEGSALEDIQDKLDIAAQDRNTSVVREVEKLGADAAPVVRVVETMRSNMIFSAVNDELNGAAGAMAETTTEETLFRKVKAWVRGLFNNADYDGTSKAQGFDADTYGVAMGVDKELDNHAKAGFGYAYSQTDVNGDNRDTDVDSHTLFVYGQYKPADWYINTALAYSWSDYEEKKSVLGYNANAKYDVETIALQSMYGFERKLSEYDLNPEFGFRYMHINQDGYTDNLGSKVKSKDSDVLTAVAGTKIAKSYELENGMHLRPELKAAVTYDLVADNNNANVMLANGAGYRVNGEKLERLGFEFGAKVAADVSDNWELAAGYELRLRKDYQDNTLMLNAKYNF